MGPTRFLQRKGWILGTIYISVNYCLVLNERSHTGALKATQNRASEKIEVKLLARGSYFDAKNKLFEQPRFKLLLERFQNARFWVALRAPVWDRSLSTRHWEPRFGVDCMKVRHTPLYRRNVFIDFYFCPLFVIKWVRSSTRKVRKL